MHSNFVTFNREQFVEQKVEEDSIAISKQDRQLLDLQKDNTESETSADFRISSSFANSNHESKCSYLQTNENEQCCQTKLLLQNVSQKSMLDYANEFEAINNLRNGVYINEHGEESLLSDSSVDHKLIKETQKTKNASKNTAPKFTKRISKICLPHTKFRKSRARKSGLLEHPKRTRHDTNVNSDSFDIQAMPKIKLDKVSKTKKSSKIRSSYQSELYSRDYRYGENQKNHKTKLNMSFDNAQNVIPPRRSMVVSKNGNPNNFRNNLNNKTFQDSNFNTRRPSSTLENDRVRRMGLKNSSKDRKSNTRDNNDFSHRREDQILVIESSVNRILEPNSKPMSIFEKHYEQGKILDNGSRPHTTSDFNSSVREKDQNYNSRCYSSCEGADLKNGLCSRNTSYCLNILKNKSKHKPISRHSGRFGRQVLHNSTNRSNTRGQAHSMYYLSNIGNYVPLSAHIRHSNDLVPDHKKSSSHEHRRK